MTKDEIAKLPTPETDAFMKQAERVEYPPAPYPIAEYARSLEQRLAAAMMLIDEHNADCERLCELRAREDEWCARARPLGSSCSDCPREWQLDESSLAAIRGSD